MKDTGKMIKCMEKGFSTSTTEPMWNKSSIWMEFNNETIYKRNFGFIVKILSFRSRNRRRFYSLPLKCLFCAKPLLSRILHRNHFLRAHSRLLLVLRLLWRNLTSFLPTSPRSQHGLSVTKKKIPSLYTKSGLVY